MQVEGLPDTGERTPQVGLERRGPHRATGRWAGRAQGWGTAHWPVPAVQVPFLGASLTALTHQRPRPLSATLSLTLVSVDPPASLTIPPTDLNSTPHSRLSSPLPKLALNTLARTALPTQAVRPNPNTSPTGHLHCYRYI